MTEQELQELERQARSMTGWTNLNPTHILALVDEVRRLQVANAALRQGLDKVMEYVTVFEGELGHYLPYGSSAWWWPDVTLCDKPTQSMAELHPHGSLVYKRCTKCEELRY